MFENFNPLEDKMYQVMDNAGKVILPDWVNPLSGEQTVKAYRDMLFERTADNMAVGYQRQGRMYTYPPNLGQEAIHIATGLHVKPEDWMVPAFRELGVWLAMGATLKEVFWYFKGNEKGSAYAKAPHLLPMSVPISTQLLHAAGLGFSLKYKGEPGAVFAFVGDGGTSEGDFHEALNFAAVWQAPVIFIIQNNQYAISLPVREQTRSINLAVKGLAYGIPSLKVDGNDFFALQDVIGYARKHVTEGNGPFLIEAVTFRQGAHTTSDDPTRYRDKIEEATWLAADPIARLKGFMTAAGLVNDLNETALIDEYKAQIDKEFEAAEQGDPYQPEEVFASMFETVPDELKRQQQALETFLNSQGEAK